MEKIFISKCCITNTYEKKTIFNHILLSFDNFSSFHFINQPLNSTPQRELKNSLLYNLLELLKLRCIEPAKI